MIKYCKRGGKGCHQNGKGYREQLLQGVTCPEKGSETDTPPVLLILMPTHTSTHTQTPLHTTHMLMSWRTESEGTECEKRGGASERERERDKDREREREKEREGEKERERERKREMVSNSS